MSKTKIRIINDKTGDVKYVSEVVAKDTKNLKAYGYKIQDLNESKKEILPPVDEVNEQTESVEEIDSIDNNEPVHNDLVEEQPAKKKPGRKPNIVTE